MSISSSPEQASVLWVERVVMRGSRPVAASFGRMKTEQPESERYCLRECVYTQ